MNRLRLGILESRRNRRDARYVCVCLSVRFAMRDVNHAIDVEQLGDVKAFGFLIRKSTATPRLQVFAKVWFLAKRQGVRLADCHWHDGTITLNGQRLAIIILSKEFPSNTNFVLLFVSILTVGKLSAQVNEWITTSHVNALRYFFEVPAAVVRCYKSHFSFLIKNGHYIG